MDVPCRAGQPPPPPVPIPCLWQVQARCRRCNSTDHQYSTDFFHLSTLFVHTRAKSKQAPRNLARSIRTTENCEQYIPIHANFVCASACWKVVSCQVGPIQDICLQPQVILAPKQKKFANTAAAASTIVSGTKGRSGGLFCSCGRVHRTLRFLFHRTYGGRPTAAIDMPFP